MVEGHFLGIYEKAINQKFSWEEKILMAKKAGFDFIELSIDESEDKIARLDWKRQDILELLTTLQKHNFQINSMCLSAHRRFPLGSQDPLIRAKALEIGFKACILAKKLGIRIIQLAAYDVYYEPSNKETYRLFILGLRKLAKFAQQYSVTLAFESMDTKLAGTIGRCLNIIRDTQSNLFFLYPDIGNLNQFTQDFEAEIESGKNWALAYHFKDTLPGIFKNIEFGKGNVDFIKSLKIIQKTGFRGPFLIEMWSKNLSEELFSENLQKLIVARRFFEDKFLSAKK